MAVDEKVSIFTTAMRTEFLLSYEALPKPAPWEKFALRLTSTARIENYVWMAPAPGLAPYVGHRRYGHSDTVRYGVENKEFDASFRVLLRDIEDDQVGGFEMQPKIMSDEANIFPGLWVMKHLANGKSRVCFDGAYMFAASHNIGTVNNIVSHTSTGSSDSASLKVIALFTGGRLKPLIWQDRKPPKFMDNMGSAESSEAKEVHYWIDMEGEAAYGWPWDAVWCDITNTPNVTDMHAIFNKLSNAFRGFQLPRALNSDEPRYPHEQSQFSSSNLVLVIPPALENVTRNALNEQLIAQAIGSNTVAVDNNFRGWADYIVTNYLA